jgi:RimJ/RimL family protein N-acetyltransferase
MPRGCSVAELVLGTERLALRHARPDDLAAWLEHLNSPEVMARLGGVQPPEKVAASFARMLANEADGELPFLVVALRSDGTVIGKCGLARIGESGAPEAIRDEVQIGWSLRADYWGHGYAREAAEAILALGFDRFDLATVFAQTSESNAASWGLMRRLGMIRRPEFDYLDPDYPPQDNPTMVWSLAREAWRAARKASAAHA